MDAFHRFLNPWLLHLQKFGLELKCPLCLNLLNRPALLPCNHIFCKFCIPRETQFGSECPTCKHQFVDREVRPAPYMENMVTIYRSLDATISASLFQPASLDAGRVPDLFPVSAKTKADAELQKEHLEVPQEKNFSNAPSIVSLTANKRAYASLDACAEDGVDFTRKNVKSSMLRSGEEESWELYSGGGMDFNVGDKLMPLLFPLQEGDENRIKLGQGNIVVSQLEQLSPGSPPSFGDTKETDGISGPGSSYNSVEKTTTKRLLDNELDMAGGDMNNGGMSGPNCHARDIKRQKNLNNGFFEIDVKSNGPAQQNNLCAENITSTSELDGKFGEPLSCEQSTMVSELQDANKSACAFCFSSEQSDVRDWANVALCQREGRVGDPSNVSNVLYIHQNCIDWSPQVYYKGEEIKNLESELARAAKLKCSTCGQKGAALGCFVKSCRKSYHLPCALNLDCKWDSEDFLMLCPSHKNNRFPREKKSKSRKHASGEKQPVPTQMISKQLNFEAASPSAAKEWVLCGSALSSEEKRCLLNFASSYGATVSRCWNPNVTHVIAATDENGACTRTLKVLMAILNGRWILTMDWIKACIKVKQPVYEEPYEVKLDNHGCHGGPRSGRLKAFHNSKKLFKGLKFYFIGDFLAAYKNDLVNLIKTAGGLVIESEDALERHSRLLNEGPLRNPLVVYNDDPKQKCNPGEESYIAEMRSKEAEKLTARIDSWAIPPSWILDSIAACELKQVPSRACCV